MKGIDIHGLAKCVLPAFENDINTKYCNSDILSNINNLTDCEINQKLEIILLQEVIQYLTEKRINYIFVKAPNKHKLELSAYNEPYLFCKISLEDILLDNSYIKSFFRNDSELIEYAYDKETGLLNGNRITTNGTNLISALFKSRYINIDTSGERKGISSTSGLYQNDIYIYGSCLTFGLFADDKRTFPSYLQEIINNSEYSGMRVHNFGVKGYNSVLNDLLFALNTPLRSGDIVIFVEKFSNECIEILEKVSMVHDFTSYLKDNLKEKHCFLNSTFHCNYIIYKLLSEYVFSIIKGLNIEHPIKDEKKEIYFQKTGKINKIDIDRLLSHFFIHKLKSKLYEKRFQTQKDDVVGCIIMAGNPFTWGHAQLVDLMSKECDYCYVMIVEDDHFDFPFSKRYEMAKNYCLQHRNCKVIGTGTYFGSPINFPEYYNKEAYKSKKINDPIIDSLIFLNHIVPILGITRRYLGSEENDPVTKQYNDFINLTLPKSGIEVKIIQRFSTKQTNEIIKGTHIRKLLKKGTKQEDLNEFLPPTSISIIMNLEDSGRK